MSHPYKLNLVYLIPSDLHAFDNVEARWTRLLKYIQDFYKTEMVRNGFGEKTFGLPFDSHGKVQFLKYNTTRGSMFYARNYTNFSIMTEEITNHFDKAPNETLSDHYLIVIPTNSSDPRNPSKSGDTPLVGYIGGRICFALDYEGFDIQYEHGDSGKIVHDIWLGGLAHELGHGFNLPHNNRRLTDPKHALMDDGNQDFETGVVKLTEASCAILNNCQVFNKDGNFYTPDEPFERQDVHIAFDASSIYISCAYDSEKKVNAVNVYVDELDNNATDTSQNNTDYDAQSWCVTDVADQRFSLTIDRSTIVRTSKDVFQIRIWYLFEDGNHQEEKHDFNHSDLKTYHYSSTSI